MGQVSPFAKFFDVFFSSFFFFMNMRDIHSLKDIPEWMTFLYLDLYILGEFHNFQL